MMNIAANILIYILSNDPSDLAYWFVSCGQ
jgi:hypothetical protein